MFAKMTAEQESFKFFANLCVFDLFCFVLRFVLVGIGFGVVLVGDLFCFGLLFVLFGF